MSVHDWIKGQHTRQGQADEANYGWDEGKWEGLDELTSGGKKTGKTDIIESYPDKKGTKQSTKKAIITNVHSRLKNIQTRIEISDFLLRSSEPQGKNPRRKKRDDGEYSTPLVKDGEFGGMNTGEVEHTEPRDTANSRVKRDKDVA